MGFPSSNFDLTSSSGAIQVIFFKSLAMTGESGCCLRDNCEAQLGWSLDVLLQCMERG